MSAAAYEADPPAGMRDRIVPAVVGLDQGPTWDSLTAEWKRVQEYGDLDGLVAVVGDLIHLLTPPPLADILSALRPVDAITAAELRYDHIGSLVSFIPRGLNPLRVTGPLDGFEAHKSGIVAYVDHPDWQGEPHDLGPDDLITLGAA